VEPLHESDHECLAEVRGGTEKSTEKREAVRRGAPSQTLRSDSLRDDVGGLLIRRSPRADHQARLTWGNREFCRDQFWMLLDGGPEGNDGLQVPVCGKDIHGNHMEYHTTTT